MKIAIVDDEKHWQELVKCHIEKYPWKEAIEIDIFSCGEELHYETEYNIIFLDIEMKELDGFATARRYKENYENAIIIFLTTHTELSRHGYMVNAFRYIDKAYMEKELEEALKAYEDLQCRNYIVSFHVLYLGEIHIQVKTILYIETEKRNVIIHTKDQDYISNRKLEELEEELKDKGFFRCHKSFLVNLENIHKIDKINVYFRNGKKAFVSVRKYTELKQKYLEQKYKMANS